MIISAEVGLGDERTLCISRMTTATDRKSDQVFAVSE